MSFRNQRNVFSPLAQGIANAAQAVAGFFQQRAEQQYNEGVSAISWAQNELDKMEQAAQDPFFEASADQRAFINQRRERLQQILTASPQEARVLRQQFQEQDRGIDVRSVITATTRNAPRGGRGGVGRPAAPGGEQARPEHRGSVTQESSTVTSSVPFSDMFNRLQSEAAQRALGREERLIQEERGFILARDEAGREHEVRISDLQRLHELQMQRNDATNREDQLRLDALLNQELVRLQSQLNISEEGVKAAYAMALTNLEQNRMAEREAAARSDQFQFESIAEARTFGRDLIADIKNVALSPEERDAAVASLEALVEANPALASMFGPSVIASARSAHDQLAQDARVTELENIVKSGDETDLRIQQAQAELDILRQNLTIGGRQIAMFDLQMAGETQRQRIEEWNHQREQWRSGVEVAMTAQDYVRTAIELGDPAAVEALLEEVRNPGTHPHLTNLAEGVTARELEQALGVAEDVYALEGRRREYAQAEITHAFRSLERGDLEGQMRLVEVLGANMTPEQIAADPDVRAMVERGQLSETHVEAAQSRAAIRVAIEQDTVNGPKIQRTLDRLATEYSGKRAAGEDLAATEAGLRAALQDLVELGNINPEEVEGLVALYKQSWSDAGSALDAELANTRAHTLALQAQAENYRADAAARRAAAARDGAEAAAIAAGKHGMSAEDRLALQAGYDAEVGYLDRRYPGCGESADAEAQAGMQLAQTNCQQYRMELDELWNRYATMYENYGVVPPSATVQNTRALQEYEANLTEEYGPEAADAMMLYLFATQEAGLRVDPFVPGEDDPIAWMDTWGYSADQVVAQYDSVLAARDAEALQLAEERANEVSASGPYMQAYQAWVASDRDLPPDEIERFAQEFGITSGQLNRLFVRTYAEQQGGLAGFVEGVGEFGENVSQGVGEAVSGFNRWLGGGQPEQPAQPAQQVSPEQQWQQGPLGRFSQDVVRNDLAALEAMMEIVPTGPGFNDRQPRWAMDAGLQAQAAAIGAKYGIQGDALTVLEELENRARAGGLR